MIDSVKWEKLEIEGEPIARKGDAEVSYFGARLPFYPSTPLLKRVNARGAEVLDTSYWLAAGSSLLELDGSSEPIHGANRLEDLSLPEDQALPYLEFFCDFVKAGGESFRVVSGPDDPVLAGLGLDEAANARIRPPRLDGRSEEGSYLLSAYVLYKGELFLASFELPPDGRVAMVDEEGIWPAQGEGD